jgi:hypothetical protein
MRRPLAIVLLLAGLATAQAADLALVNRESTMSGNFLVGFATLSDRGDYSQIFTTPDLSFSNSVADAGGVNGFHSTTPVVGSGSFSTTQDYAVSPLLITLSGSVSNTLSTPFTYVSAGANASSVLELEFDISVPTAFTLSGQLSELLGASVNSAAPLADTSLALRGLTTGVGFWLFSIPGSFAQSGVMQPGRWLLSAQASSRINADASYVGSLVLSPVSEPNGAWLLTGGAAALWLRLRRRPALVERKPHAARPDAAFEPGQADNTGAFR